jgi:hypothetical protein
MEGINRQDGPIVKQMRSRFIFDTLLLKFLSRHQEGRWSNKLMAGESKATLCYAHAKLRARSAWKDVGRGPELLWNLNPRE